MNEINSNTDVKSSKKGLINFLIAIIFLSLAIGLGFGITKYLDADGIE